MPKFEATESRVFTVNAPKDDVVTLMTQPANFVELLADLEKHEAIDDKTYRFVLIEKNEKGVRFKGDYTVQYDYDGDKTLTWKTTSEGNMSSTGKATFKALGDTRTSVDYTETIVCDMDVNRLLAKVIKPIVNREISKGVGGYLDRVIDKLQS